MQRCRDTERLGRIKTGIETNRQIEIQTYIQTDKQIDRQNPEGGETANK